MVTYAPFHNHWPQPYRKLIDDDIGADDDYDNDNDSTDNWCKWKEKPPMKSNDCALSCVIFTLTRWTTHEKHPMKEWMNEYVKWMKEWKNERIGDREKSAANTKSTRERRNIKTNLFIGIYYMLISYFELSIRWQQLHWSSSYRHRHRRRRRRRRCRTHKLLLLLQPVQSEES